MWNQALKRVRTRRLDRTTLSWNSGRSLKNWLIRVSLLNIKKKAFKVHLVMHWVLLVLFFFFLSLFFPFFAKVSGTHGQVRNEQNKYTLYG